MLISKVKYIISKIFFYCAAFFCRIALKIFWKRVDILPKEIDKGIILLAPHTSSWDGFWGIIYSLSYLNYNRDIKMAFRQESNTSIMGSILKFFGAYFIDRHNTEKKGINAINELSNVIKKSNRIYLGIFAEGTRAPVKSFNPGFYYIAYKANVPILTLKFNYGKSVIESGPIIIPIGSYKKDLPIWEIFFKDAIGKNPKKFKIFDDI